MGEKNGKPETLSKGDSQNLDARQTDAPATRTGEAADLARMLDAASCGLIQVDKQGLVERVNRRAAELLGETEAYLRKKPIAFFIAPEDQAVFYVNRSRMAAEDAAAAPFEIRFKPRHGDPWIGRVHARPVHLAGQHLPGLLMAVEDVSDYRQALESLQIKSYAIELLCAITDDLSVWSPDDIDAAIDATLEKIGLMAGADRVYVGLFHHRRARFSITHEWLGKGAESPSLAWVSTRSLAGFMQQLKKRGAVRIDDLSLLDDAHRNAHTGFHAPGSRSVLFAPLSYGRSVVGIIGCDVVDRGAAWSAEDGRMILHIGDAIVNALVRRQTEKFPAGGRELLFQFVEPPTPLRHDAEVEYDGPIEFIEEAPDAEAPPTEKWQLVAMGTDEGEPDTIATLKDGQRANLACRACYRQRVLDIGEIRALGSRIQATCPCGQPLRVRVELRREYRKTVHLEGLFMRASLNHLAPAATEWGRITVCNLSRHGVAFKPFGRRQMQIGDHVRVKFSLDNAAKSMIQKEVSVCSLAGDVVGCEFIGRDPCDVTIGFYMMT